MKNWVIPHGRWLEEGLRKTVETLMTHPSHAYYFLFREEGMPPDMFLFGRRLTVFLDFEKSNMKLSKCNKQAEALLSITNDHFLFDTS